MSRVAKVKEKRMCGECVLFEELPDRTKDGRVLWGDCPVKNHYVLYSERREADKCKEYERKG